MASQDMRKTNNSRGYKATQKSAGRKRARKHQRHSLLQQNVGSHSFEDHPTGQMWGLFILKKWDQDNLLSDICLLFSRTAYMKAGYLLSFSIMIEINIRLFDFALISLNTVKLPAHTSLRDRANQVKLLQYTPPTLICSSSGGSPT